MSKMVKRISLKQGDEKEYFYFDATTGIKGYDLYSEDEMVIGRWTDGKPIYRKTIRGKSPSRTSTTTTVASLSSLNIDRVITFIPNWESSTYFFPPSYSGGGQSIYYNKNTKNIDAWTNVSDYVNVDVTVEIEYTKTTDQSDSFVEEKVELTAEHNTGFTFNGEDVYEMVITGRTNASSNDTDVDVSGLNIKSIISLYGFLGITSVSSSYSSWAIPYSWGGSANDFLALYFPGTSLDYNTLKITVGTATRRNQPYTISIRYTKK